MFLGRNAGVGGISVAIGLALSLVWPGPRPARAERIVNDIAVFAALDKVTARISPLEVRLGRTVAFGPLKVTPRACNTRPPTEPPVTSAFVEVDETQLDGSSKRIFTGWMFAQSPGLHGVEHPVFDIWLTSCKAPHEEGAASGPQPGGPSSAGAPSSHGGSSSPGGSSWGPQPD